jgi:2,4-dienoyl-CoA reductase-like NADH-dependent reductase (Old Yellow Enzyme family)
MVADAGRTTGGVGNGPDLSGLYTPFTIKGITLANRFVMPGMGRRASREGRPLPELGRYYARRVQGGVALVITEAVAVDHPSATQVPHYGWIREDTLDAWALCASQVREAGGHFFLQLWHEGAVRPEGGDGPYATYPTLSPSGLVHGTRPNGRAANAEDLTAIKDAFVRGAVAARQIGASGVEVHACHGYLLDQFLWAETNRRQDGYGGDELAARVRFPAEIVGSIRSAVGPDFVISIRISQWKEVNYEAKIAQSPEDLAFVLKTFRSQGADIMHVSTRRFWEPEWPGSDLGLAGWAKRLTDAPVIAVGSVGLDIDVMESLFGRDARSTGETGLQELARRFSGGEFDLISVGRGQIGDPDWVRKVRDGRIAEIRPFTKQDVRGDGAGLPDFVADAHR